MDGQMSYGINQLAVDAVEKKLVNAKREAKHLEQLWLPVPDYLARKISNLKGAANALRNGKTEGAE